MSDAQTEEISSDDVANIKRFYDDVYHQHAGQSPQRPNAHLLRLHKKLGIAAGSHVLDVACGAGEWLQVCSGKGSQVAGVDLSSKAINVCRERIPNGVFFDQPAEQLPFADNTFDVVTCLGSLEHFVDPQTSLREMVRVAKADAIFCILVPNADFLTRKVGLFRGTYQVAAKEVVRTLDEWNSLFASSGLHVDRRWRDLHVISRAWITQGSPLLWPVRAAQALALAVWPLRWQYQVYHQCTATKAADAR